MMLSGRRFWILLLVVFAAARSQAALEVAVDRQEVALGDSIRLVITATADEDLDALDLRRLLADFEILQRSATSSTSIVNGQRSQTRQVLLDLSPRREGLLAIPGLRIGASTSEPVAVEVGPPPAPTDANQTVVVSAEVDSQEVYVQGQILLTVRIQQAINLDSRSVSELQLDNAYVQPLEQNSFQRTQDGRPWLVHEVRYAIFPEQSGTLTIPPQVFTGRESSGRRSVFDFGSGGRQLQRRTEPLTVNVLPRPSAFPANDTWLPARDLVLEESWSKIPDTLQAGESVTRTIPLRGTGLQGAQLPPITFEAQDGLRYYPDQPAVTDAESAAGLVGQRRESAALVANRAGRFTLPEIRIPWWDVAQDTVRYAVLPARDITVAPGASATASPAATQTESPGATDALLPLDPAPKGHNRLWQWLTAFFAVLWVATIALFWRLRPAVQATPPNAPPRNNSEARAFKQLQAACASDSAAPARAALLHWAQAYLDMPRPLRADELARHLGDDSLSQAIAELDAALYRSGSSQWRGAALAAAVTELRRRKGGKRDRAVDTFALYPTTTS